MSLVDSFQHLKGRPHEEKALPLLQRIASLVKPIMRKHDWRLPLLAEFFPDNDSLVGLNVNGGQKILLRLRPAWAPDTFYDEEQLVLVMLHELTHNVHGPHDQKFYKYLGELEDEYEALKRSGYSGEGFHSKGVRVGQGVSHDLPPHLAKTKALEAAEKRRKTSSLMSGGAKLGGRRITTKTPRELAAEAAERRARDEKACGSGIDAQKEAAKAAQNSVEDKAIDLDNEFDRDSSPKIILLDTPPVAGPSKVHVPAAAKPTGIQKRRSPVPLPTIAPARPVVPVAAKSSTVAPTLASKSGEEWSCPTCTLLNPPLALQCSACLSNRPMDQSLGWACLSCGETEISHQYWTCTFCGWVKQSSEAVA